MNELMKCGSTSSLVPEMLDFNDLNNIFFHVQVYMTLLNFKKIVSHLKFQEVFMRIN